jgi:hypothetical protein
MENIEDDYFSFYVLVLYVRYGWAPTLIYGYLVNYTNVTH